MMAFQQWFQASAADIMLYFSEHQGLNYEDGDLYYQDLTTYLLKRYEKYSEQCDETDNPF